VSGKRPSSSKPHGWVKLTLMAARLAPAYGPAVENCTR
jgi:hypothetical protein